MKKICKEIVAYKEFRPTAYQEGDIWKIGYGTPSFEGEEIDKEEAENRLEEAVNEIAIFAKRSGLKYFTKALIKSNIENGTLDPAAELLIVENDKLPIQNRKIQFMALVNSSNIKPPMLYHAVNKAVNATEGDEKSFWEGLLDDITNFGKWLLKFTVKEAIEFLENWIKDEVTREKYKGQYLEALEVEKAYMSEEERAKLDSDIIEYTGSRPNDRGRQSK